MPIVTLRISRRWARMLKMLAEGVVDSDKPEDILEFILDRIHLGVFWPDSNLRPVVRHLFDDYSSAAPTWEAPLVADSKGVIDTSTGPAVALLRFHPRHLCADVVDDDTKSIIVYRPADPCDLEDFWSDEVQVKFDVQLGSTTEDNLTRARMHNRSRLVYHVHESPILASWFLADRRAEQRNEPSPPIPQHGLEDWTRIREFHGVPDEVEGYEMKHYGLPEAPERDVRGDPFWR